VRRTSLPGSDTAAGAARRFLRAALADWTSQGLPEAAAFPDRVVDDATLLISELVTNAVVHAGTTVDVVCRLDAGEPSAGLVIEVADRHPARVLRGSPAESESEEREAGAGSGDGGPSGDPGEGGAGAPEAGAESPADSREGGRGLHLVAALSHSWGVTYHRDRKTVWCRIDLAADSEYSCSSEQSGAAGSSDQAGSRDRQDAGDASDGADARTGPVGRLGALADGAPGTTAELLAPTAPPPPPRADTDWISRGTLTFLAEASDLLAGQLDEDNVASLAAQLLVPRLADWCAVWLYPTSGGPRLSRVWHRAEHRVEPLRALLEKHPPAPGVRSGAQRLPRSAPRASPPNGHTPHKPVPAASYESAYDPGRGAPGIPPDLPRDFGEPLSVPLVAAGRCHGTLLLGRAGPPGLPAEATGLIEDFARRVALAMGTARQYARQAMISTVLQRGLLPPATGRIPGMEHAVVYEPMAGDWVGGDFYDLFPAGDGRWCFALGDVCGSGPEAASMTGIARPVLRLLAREGCGVSDVLDRLNKALAEEAATALIGEIAAWEGGQARFLSLLYGEILPYAPGHGARCTLASAGHPLPLVLAPDGSVRPAARPQMLLGISDEARYTSETFDLAPGDTLLCVTDGVTERRRGARQFDDDDGLAAVLRGCTGLPATDIAERIRQAVHDYDTSPPPDDLALLVLQAR
jgi:serine phosphatase RsbU (regulator of sigma subunit)/anti-sigma regulatory factor (Ser/Thr protein kinase)